MDYLWEGTRAALKMIVSFDPELISATLISLKVSTLSILLATLVGIPLGFWVGIKEFWGREIVVTFLHTLMGLPTVAVGLLVYSFLSRRGPLGTLELLYTPWAMVIGQFILALPIVATLSLSATQSVDKRVEKTALTLGATPLQTASIIFWEGRFAFLAALTCGFGRVFAEVGVSMMVGGNIRGFTRNLTTAIAFEVSRGEFSLGIALGIILLTLAFSINLLFRWLRKKV